MLLSMLVRYTHLPLPVVDVIITDITGCIKGLHVLFYKTINNVITLGKFLQDREEGKR